MRNSNIKTAKTILTITAIFLFASTLANAYTIDGDLSDWGVTPFSNWQPSSATAAWDEGNHTGSNPYPHGGETFDIEALYVDTDDDYIYIAVVLSMPPEGVDSLYNRHYFAGDIGLNLDNDGSTGEDGYEFGLGTHPGNIGQLFYMPDWSLPNGSVGIPANGPSTIESGIFVANASMIYANAGDLEGNGTDTFIIETAISLADIGHEITQFDVHFTIDCGNDILEVASMVPTQNIPEPSTIVILGAGLAFTAGVIRRKLNM